MSAAVVILNYNGEALLRQFLPAVVAHTPPAVALCVADNASTDDSWQLLRTHFPQVRLLALDKNYGFAEGYNRALALVDADYFVLLNSDVQVSDNWLTPLIAFLDAHDEVAMVQPKILKYQSTTFEYAGAAGGFLDKYAYPYCRGRLMSTLEEDHNQYDDALEVDWVSGACCVVRAADYRSAGGFDARFFAHHEEIDLCWRLRLRGRRLFCVPTSTIWHIGGATLPASNPQKTYLNFRNNLIMIYKNMSSARLAGTLRARRVLDNIAAIKYLLTGQWASARAVWSARKDFYDKKETFKHDREMIQQTRLLPPAADTQPLSLIYQYFLRHRKKWSALPAIVSLLLLLGIAPTHADDKTRGVGVYPGRVSEAFAPTIIAADSTYRNLSRYHQVIHSSAYDYNLTGQLLTDGLTTTALPPHVSVLVNGAALPKNEREYAFDGNDWNRIVLPGSNATLVIRWEGMTVAVDSIVVNATVAYDAACAGGYDLCLRAGNTVLAHESEETLIGEAWGVEQHSDPNKQRTAETLPVRKVCKGYAFEAQALTALGVDLTMEGAEYWTISDIKFFSDGAPVDTALLPLSHFASAWMSAAGGEQWAYVDLGAAAEIDAVRLYWVSAAPQGRLEVSDDAQTWTAVGVLPTAAQEYSVPLAAQGRYVRVVVNGQDEPYILSEMEVYGRGGTTVVPCAAPAAEDSRLSLNGGAWALLRDYAGADGARFATEDYSPTEWLPATVPATVLSAYVNACAVPEQNYDNNVEYASESYFYSNFFYRRTFRLPATFANKRVFLNLDGVNWKAQVWLNGHKLGRVEGAFMRGKIDITALVAEENVLVIEVERPAHPGTTKEKTYLFPGANGGLLGADNPTFHASVGWDWIPTVRGREIGIWNDVFLTAETDLFLSDPLVSTTLNLPDTLVTMTPTVCYSNLSPDVLRGRLCGWIGNITFEKELTVERGAGEVTFSPEEFPILKNARLQLWWPNGYGAPFLHEAGFCFLDAAGDTLAVVRYQYGARQVTYEDVDTALKIYVNGHRVAPRGGNWGFSEQNLNFRQREYDVAVGYHKDMHFNMIRNWVGQIGDEEFYNACDRNGIMVWQDFWLANPADGPDPSDEALFERNALDYVLKIRQHPSVVLYCGRNEGYPPPTIDASLRQITTAYHPGIAYISSSADDGVSGHGPYNALPAREYFSQQTGLLHSERGMPCIMTAESLQRTLRPAHLWPQGDVWGEHDYTMNGAQKGASFNEMIAARFGEAAAAEQFATWAQLINYEGYRAMFEATSKDRMGLLLWMSHACWPSLSWQCYDYYFCPTGAYYGCRAACEPLHIQYNALSGRIEVVNSGIGERRSLRAQIERYTLGGTRVKKSEVKLRAKEDSTTELVKVSPAEGEVLRLRLYDNKTLISENTYILAEDLSPLEPAAVTMTTGETAASADSLTCCTTITLTNDSGHTAYLLRLQLQDDAGQDVLPVWYSDNFFHLFPYETKDITIRWAREDQLTDGVAVRLTGLNITE